MTVYLDKERIKGLKASLMEVLDTLTYAEHADMKKDISKQIGFLNELIVLEKGTLLELI